MKFRILLLVLIIGSVWAYYHPEETRAYLGKATRYAGDELLKVSQKWAPENTSEKVVASFRELPPDVYVLRQTVPAGSSGEPPIPMGTELRKIGEGNGKVVLTAGSGASASQVIVNADQITRDPKEASLLRERNQMSQRSVMNESRAKLESQLSKLSAEIKSTSTELGNLREEEAQAKVMGKPPRMVTNPALLEQRLARLQAQSAELRRQIALMPPPPPPAKS